MIETMNAVTWPVVALAAVCGVTLVLVSLVVCRGLVRLFWGPTDCEQVPDVKPPVKKFSDVRCPNEDNLTGHCVQTDRPCATLAECKTFLDLRARGDA